MDTQASANLWSDAAAEKSAKTPKGSKYTRSVQAGVEHQQPKCPMRRSRTPARKHPTVLKISPHSSCPSTRDQTHQAPLRQPQSIRQGKRIKWPKSSDNTVWTQFDDVLDSILEVTLSGPVHQKVDSLTTIAHNLDEERFSPVEQKASPKHRI